MVLPDGVKPGIPAAEYFNVESDYCLEVELTPNRVDAASHYGVARDLKALFTREQCLGDSVGGTPEINVPDASAFRRTATTAGHRSRSSTVRDAPDTAESPSGESKSRNLPNGCATCSRPSANVPSTTWWTSPTSSCSDSDSRSTASTSAKCQEAKSWCVRPRRDEVHHARRHRTHAERLRPDDMRRREANVHSRSIRRHVDSGVTESTTDVFIESGLFQPDTREAHRTPPRPGDRCVVPLRARHRPRHNGLRRKAGRSADQGACRRRDARRCERLIS